MNISIIIPTFNAMDNIDQLLLKLKNQKGNYSIELVVIDSSSNDGTANFLLQKSGIHFMQIPKSEFNHGGTRNKAVSASSGDILIFMTQDALPMDENFVYYLIHPIITNQATATYGRQVARKDATVIERLTREFNYPAHDILKSKDVLNKMGIKTFFFTNVCSAIRRSDFLKLGGFPDNTILNEDMLLAYKLIMDNKKIMFASNARVAHSHNYTCMQQFKRNFDIGVSLRIDNKILAYIHSESEGKKFVSYILKELVRQKEYVAMFKFICESLFKLTGYKLGINFKRLPISWIRRMSMNPEYWK